MEESKNMIIPVRDKLNLTIKEAAEYSNISEKTLRNRIHEYGDDCNFILRIGTKILIKRKKFEEFLDKTDII